MRVLLASLVAAACASGPGPTVRLEAGWLTGETILAAVPAHDLRINARVPPAIELATGGVIRLTRGPVSADSSYFLEPPWEVRPAGVPIRGTLRVSFCQADERVCWSVTFPVDLQE